jgi:3-oxoacyl-(acyl-carrier-protein) synthase
LDPEEKRRKVLGEGAGALLLETLSSVRERNASVWAELLGYGMGMDLQGYTEQCLGTAGIVRAVTVALERSGLAPTDIDAVVWAPQGNIQDLKISRGLSEINRNHFAAIPFYTTTFNTGYIESASAMVTLGMLLYGLSAKKELWPQKTGMPEFDGRKAGRPIRRILVAGSSDLGYSFALALDTKPELSA